MVVVAANRAVHRGGTDHRYRRIRQRRVRLCTSRRIEDRLHLVHGVRAEGVELRLDHVARGMPVR